MDNLGVQLRVPLLSAKQLDDLFLDGVVVFDAFNADALEQIKVLRSAAQVCCPYIVPERRLEFFLDPPVSSFGGICATDTSAVHRAIAAAFDPVHAQIAERMGVLRGRPGECYHFIGPDRECVRRVGAKLSGEKPHRDLSSPYARRGQALPVAPARAKRARRDVDPDLFVDGLGGWISFSGPSSFTFDRGNFELGPGRAAQGKGFQPTDEEMTHRTTLQVRPGQAILFFSSILHTVPSSKVAEKHWRQFIAAGFTFSPDGNFHSPETLRAHFDGLHPFPLPSGQPPRAWPVNYDLNWHDRRARLRAFFVPELTSDRALHLPIPPSPHYPAYSPAERALYSAHKTALPQ